MSWPHKRDMCPTDREARPWYSAAEVLGMERYAITWVAGTAGHIIGLTVLLYTNDICAVQTNHTIKPPEQGLYNLKMVEA